MINILLLYSIDVIMLKLKLEKIRHLICVVCSTETFWFTFRDGKLEKFQVIYRVEDYFIDPLDVSSVLIYQQEMYFIVLSDRIRDNVMLFKYEGAQGFTFHSAVTARRGKQYEVI